MKEEKKFTEYLVRFWMNSLLMMRNVMCCHWISDGLKFKKVQAKKFVKSNESKEFFFVKLHFWQFETFSRLKKLIFGHF